MIIGVANSVAVLAELESEDFEDAPPIDDQLRTVFGLDNDMALEAAVAARNDAEQLLQLFVG